MVADPANMDFDENGAAIQDEGENNQDNVDTTPQQSYNQDGTGTKIDYSNVPPIQFQKTATLVNYFITNTAQFLNT